MQTNNRKPRRTLHRLALALFGFMLAGGGQYYFGQKSFWDGLLLYLPAIALFVLALGDRVSFFLPAGSLSNSVSPMRQRIGGGLLLAACISAFGAYTLFATPDGYIRGWQLHGLSLLFLIGGGLTLGRGERLATLGQRYFPTRAALLGFAGVLALALFMRLYNFDSQPFGIWYDEAEAGLQARHFLSDDNYRPLFYMPINITGQLLGLYAFAMSLLGDHIYALRSVSVIFGVAGVVMAYLLGCELRDPRFGLILATILAFMRWHVNFSRIAMTGIDAPFFELLTLFFLVRFIKRGRLRDAMWLGVSLGTGLLFYTAFRLFTATLVLFVILGTIFWLRWVLDKLTQRGGLQVGINLAVLLISAWLLVLPLVRFAQDNPDQFWFRVRQASILTKRDQADLTQAIWSNTQKHLLMFNVHGDNNGRHNMPGWPQLDPVVGLLFVLGLFLALRNIHQPPNLFALMLFPIGLAGGILSVDFEAPQSLRVIGTIPAIVYFSGLALSTILREAEQSLAGLSRRWVAVPTALVIGAIFYHNATTYFITYANDFSSWNAYSTPETITGQKMAELGPDYVYYTSPFLTNHPSVRFLAPEVKEQKPLLPPDALPVREPPGRPAALFIHPDDRWIFEKAQRLYPNAQFEAATPEEVNGPPVIYFADLSGADLAGIQGLELKYWPADGNDDATRLLVPDQAQRALTVQANWPTEAPEMFREQLDFRAEWRGILYVPKYGPHSFRLVTPAGGLLEINGQTVLSGPGEQVSGITLAQGHHTIRVEAEGAAGEVALFWQPPFAAEEIIPQWSLYAPPVTNRGLLGTFYGNENFEGQPVLQRVDPFLDSYYHFPPLRRPYSVEWTGSLVVPQSGIYSFGLRAVQEAQLILNGQLLISTSAPNQLTENVQTLEAGLHQITIRFKDTVDRSRIHLYWATPSGAFEPIPSENLWPPLAEPPELPVITEAEPAIVSEPITLNWLTTLGGFGNGDGQFSEPRDVVVLPDQRLAVADTANRRVQILTSEGVHLQTLTGEGVEPFAEPLAVAVTGQGDLLVLDSTLQWIYRYTADGEFVEQFGGPTAQLFHPRRMTVFEDGTIAVADTGGARVTFFTADGTGAGSIGGLGSGPGQFNEPTDLLRTANGGYLVAEAENNRLQLVDNIGNPLASWVIPPAYAYDGPHLATAPDGSAFVTDSQGRSLLRYSLDGNLLNQWQAIGPVAFSAPVGIFFDNETARLYVTDVWTHQIYVFEVE